ncbi:unnamed protein product, partial [Rhizoctonia solani]
CDERESPTGSSVGYHSSNSSESDDDSVHESNSNTSFNGVVEAWNKLDDIVIRVRTRSETFVYPPKLDFIPARGNDNGPLINQQSLRNRAFVGYWNCLYRSLDELNGMEPLSERMSVALGRAIEEVNGELDKLEDFAAALWEKECRTVERMRFWSNVFSGGYDDDA